MERKPYPAPEMRIIRQTREDEIIRTSTPIFSINFEELINSSK